MLRQAKKQNLVEGIEDRKIAEVENLRKIEFDKNLEKERVNDDVIKQHMGIRWYLLPWRRQAERERISKLVAITAELETMENSKSKLDMHGPAMSEIQKTGY